MKAIAKNKKLALNALLLVAAVLMSAVALAAIPSGVRSASAAEIDYSFEAVPVEQIKVSVDDSITEIQPRQSFGITYEISPWYTTTSKVYYDVFPMTAATIVETQSVKVTGNKAIGKAEVRVSQDAVVGSEFGVTVSADGIASNKVELSVIRIPVTGLELSITGSDDRLHVGKTRQTAVSFTPSYATNQLVNYSLGGSGVEYIEYFNAATGEIKAKSNVVVIDIKSTLIITATSADNPNIASSVTLTLYMPSTRVELSADTPLHAVTADNKPLAVAKSSSADTVTLSTLINGVPATGLNYVIVAGQEYVADGIVRSNGTFEIKQTTSWTNAMKVPHAEIKIRVAYSDGFDEITIAIYVPIEKIEFVNSVTTNVENYRSYNLAAEAFPKYATYLADNAVPIKYTLNGLDPAIAYVSEVGIVSLPKSLTSKNTAIHYSAYLSNAWGGVDAAPLTHDLTIVPVYARAFDVIGIFRGGVQVDLINDKIKPNDVLDIVVSYTINGSLPENVTEISFGLSVLGNADDNAMLKVSGTRLFVSALSLMKENTPDIKVGVSYSYAGKGVSDREINIPIYVPAQSAEISDAVFHRDAALNVGELVTVNEHGFATNHAIEWGEPTVVTVYNGQTAAQINPTCINGLLRVNSVAHAGTVIKVPYRTYDSAEWQYKTFTVAPLQGAFSVGYGNDGGYVIDLNSPQLEEGRTIDLFLSFKGVGASEKFGVSYEVTVISENATLEFQKIGASGDVFRLGATSGQSGRNNYISYRITITDGTSVYCVYTNNLANPSATEVDSKQLPVEIFKRISEKLDVSNMTIGVGGVFVLTGWDAQATAKNDKGEYVGESLLIWTVSGADITNTKMMPSGITGGFELTLSATQKYNGDDLYFAKKITFDGTITYMNDDTLAKRIYKKAGAATTIEALGLCTKTDYVQAGWTETKDGNKSTAYVAGRNYSASGDLILYAWWARTKIVVRINDGGAIEAVEDKGHYHTESQTVTLKISELRALGYTKIAITGTFDVTARYNIALENQHVWLDINGANVWQNFSLSVPTDWTSRTIRVNIDLSKFTDNFTIGFGFESKGYVPAHIDNWYFGTAILTLTAVK